MHTHTPPPMLPLGLRSVTMNMWKNPTRPLLGRFLSFSHKSATASLQSTCCSTTRQTAICSTGERCADHCTSAPRMWYSSSTRSMLLYVR